MTDWGKIYDMSRPFLMPDNTIRQFCFGYNPIDVFDGGRIHYIYHLTIDFKNHEEINRCDLWYVSMVTFEIHIFHLSKELVDDCGIDLLNLSDVYMDIIRLNVNPINLGLKNRHWLKKLAQTRSDTLT